MPYGDQVLVTERLLPSPIFLETLLRPMLSTLSELPFKVMQAGSPGQLKSGDLRSHPSVRDVVTQEHPAVQLNGRNDCQWTFGMLFPLIHSIFYEQLGIKNIQLISS